MRHHLRHYGALATATLALASVTATAADEFRGTFRGTWPDGQATEITVVRLDEDGNAYGAYCHLSSRATHRFLLDLHPNDGVTARLKDGALRFALGGGKWAFRVDPADPDVVRMAFRRTETRELDLERSDKQTCASRLVQLTPPVDAPRHRTVAEAMPDDPGHWAIGSWTATRPSGLPVELSLLDVKNGRGYGIYCNLRGGPSYMVHDVHPDKGLNARVTRNKVSFRINKIQFVFKRTGDDTVEATRRHKGKKTTVEGQRTDEPACASRITARPTP